LNLFDFLPHLPLESRTTGLCSLIRQRLRPAIATSVSAKASAELSSRVSQVVDGRVKEPFLIVFGLGCSARLSLLSHSPVLVIRVTTDPFNLRNY